MNAVIEALAGIETILEVRDAHEDSPSSTIISEVDAWPARFPLRQAKQLWSSSLCEKDLQCLLRVLEGDLIPQLLNSYSPAKHGSDGRLATG